MAPGQVLGLSRVLRRTASQPATKTTTTTESTSAPKSTAHAGKTAGYDGAALGCAALGFLTPADEQAGSYFREHSGAVFRYIAGVYGREDDAEEVTQEAFLRMHQALLARVVIERPRAWALTVARRLMLDRLRHEQNAAARTVTVGTEVLEAVRDSAPSPEDTLAARRRFDALQDGIRNLTDLERQCLFARAEGLTLREIGEVVNLDLRRVAEIVARSVRALQGHLRA